MVQATCRKNGWPLDKSTLYTSVTNYGEPDDVTERIHQGKNHNNKDYFFWAREKKAVGTKFCYK